MHTMNIQGTIRTKHTYRCIHIHREWRSVYRTLLSHLDANI